MMIMASYIYAKSRIDKENPFLEIDTDMVPCLDSNKLVRNHPVVLSDSPVLYAYAVHVHLKIRLHSSIEATDIAVCTSRIETVGPQDSRGLHEVQNNGS